LLDSLLQENKAFRERSQAEHRMTSLRWLVVLVVVVVVGARPQEGPATPVIRDVTVTEKAETEVTTVEIQTTTAAKDEATPADETTTAGSEEPEAATTPAAAATVEATTTTGATIAATPAADTTPAPSTEEVETTSASSETTTASEEKATEETVNDIEAKEVDEILTLVAEEIVAEEIAEEVVAEKVAEEIIAEAEELAEVVALEMVAGELAEEIIAEELVKELIAEEVLAEDLAELKEEETVDSIIAIIDTLPAMEGEKEDLNEEEMEEEVEEEEEDNLIRDIQPVVVEEVKEIQLRITIQPGDSAVFKRGTVLGLQCDAYSEVDNSIEFSWTRDGRFIDTSTGHVTYESSSNGNIIIYSAGPSDEGLYQCVASNSEGVVFSRVSKVRQRKYQSRVRSSAGRALNTGLWVVQPQQLLAEPVDERNLQVVMGEPVL